MNKPPLLLALLLLPSLCLAQTYVGYYPTGTTVSLQEAAPVADTLSLPRTLDTLLVLDTDAITGLRYGDTMLAGDHLFIAQHDTTGRFGVLEVDIATRDTTSYLIRTTTGNRHDGGTFAEMSDGRIAFLSGGHYSDEVVSVSTDVGTFAGGWSSVSLSVNWTYPEIHAVPLAGGGTRLLATGTKSITGDNRDMAYKYSDDGGQTWSDEVVVASAGDLRVYYRASYSPLSGRVLVTMTNGSPSYQGTVDGHLMIFDPNTLAWVNAAGDPLTLPVELGPETLFYDTSENDNEEIYWSHEAFEDASGNIYAYFNAYYDETAYTRAIRVMWDGDSWTKQTIRYDASGGVPEPQSLDSTFDEVFLRAPDTGDYIRGVQLYSTDDGGETWTGETYAEGMDPSREAPFDDVVIPSIVKGGDGRVPFVYEAYWRSGESSFNGWVYVPIFSTD